MELFNNQPVWNGASVNVDSRSFCQTLTEEEMNSLKQAHEEFTLGITKEDSLRAICMHRNMQGHSTLEAYDGVSGKAKCAICGEVFNVVDTCDDQSIKDAVDNLIDILQTTKTLYVDMPVEAAKRFYPILALLKKVPGLYKVSIENFQKHENAMNDWSYNKGTTIGNYNMLYSGFNPTINPNMMYSAPYMNAYMGQPAMMQQPVMGQPIAPQNQGNPFGANGQPVAYQPQMTGFAYNAPVAPAAPAPAAAPAAADPNKDITVNTQFPA